jgi:hypothetical protein
MEDYNTPNEGYDSGPSSQDKGKGKERDIVNRFPNPPQPNQNYSHRKCHPDGLLQ